MASNCGINEGISRGRAVWMPHIPKGPSLSNLISMESKALCPQGALHKFLRRLNYFMKQCHQMQALTSCMHSRYLWVRTLISGVRIGHCEYAR